MTFIGTDFNFGPFGIFLVADVNDQVVSAWRRAHRNRCSGQSRIRRLGGGNGFDEGVEVHVIDMGVVDLSPGLHERRSLLIVGRTFSASSSGT